MTRRSKSEAGEARPIAAITNRQSIRVVSACGRAFLISYLFQAAPMLYVVQRLWASAWRIRALPRRRCSARRVPTLSAAQGVRQQVLQALAAAEVATGSERRYERRDGERRQEGRRATK